jgi:hypothetical protein
MSCCDDCGVALHTKRMACFCTPYITGKVSASWRHERVMLDAAKEEVLFLKSLRKED